MSTYWPPKRATQFIMYVALESVATAGTFLAAPSLSSGDVKSSQDGGALANLTTLPTVTPSGGKMVKVTLSSTEMTADNVTVVFSQVSGGTWKDLVINLSTVANQNDDMLTQGTGANQISLASGLVTLAGVTHTGATIPTVTTVNGLASGVITAASIAADAITAAKIADGAIDAATFAAGAINANAIASSAITAAKFATDAIDATALAASAVTEIQAGLATPTNITAGVITTVTNLTNAPTSGDLTTTMKNSVTTAATAATPTAAAVTGSVGSVVSGVVVTTNNDKTGYALSAAGAKAILDVLTSALTTVGSFGKLIVDFVAAYTAPDNTSITAIKAKTDNLPAAPASTTNITAGTITNATNVTNGVTLANGAITAAKFAPDAIDANALANSAVSEIVTALMAYVLESGKDYKTALLDIWSTTVGDGVMDDPTTPTTGSYKSPDGTVQITYTITPTNRTLS